MRDVELMRCIGCGFLIDSLEFVLFLCDMKCPRCRQVNFSDFAVIHKQKTPH